MARFLYWVLGTLVNMYSLNRLFMIIRNIAIAKTDRVTMSCERFMEGCLMKSTLPKN